MKSVITLLLNKYLIIKTKSCTHQYVYTHVIAHWVYSIYERDCLIFTYLVYKLPTNINYDVENILHLHNNLDSISFFTQIADVCTKFFKNRE